MTNTAPGTIEHFIECLGEDLSLEYDAPVLFFDAGRYVSVAGAEAVHIDVVDGTHVISEGKHNAVLLGAGTRKKSLSLEALLDILRTFPTGEGFLLFGANSSDPSRPHPICGYDGVPVSFSGNAADISDEGLFANILGTPASLDPGEPFLVEGTNDAGDVDFAITIGDEGDFIIDFFRKGIADPDEAHIESLESEAKTVDEALADAKGYVLEEDLPAKRKNSRKKP